MKKMSTAAVLAAGILFCTFTVKGDDKAYLGVNDGDFGIVDLTTGDYTILGNSGQTLAGMAVEDGQLFASSYHTTGELYTVNVANGSVSPVGPSSIDYDTFGSTTAGLFAIDTSENLYSINPTTGASTLIGPTGLGFGSWRNLSTNSGTLYYADGASLYTVSTTTGATTLVGNMGGPEMGALVVEDGKLYGGQDSPSLEVDVIDPLTGSTTVGPALSGSSSPFYAMAPYPVPVAQAAVPEPSTYALMLGGLGLLAFWRIRKGRSLV